VDKISPYYLFEEDAIHFHKRKTACDKHNPSFTQNIKQCDAYFWNAHRHEARGIGGLFSIIVKQLKR
jgi:coproporphyrinogen III oxidase